MISHNCVPHQFSNISITNRDVEMPSSKKYVILNFYRKTQEEITESLKKYGRMRDYFNRPIIMAPFYMLVKHLAEAANSTLVTLSFAKHPGIF